MIAWVLAISFSVVSYAQEKSGGFPGVAVSQEVKTKIKTGGTVAIFLNGNDALFTKVMEDALAIQLINTGFAVVPREKLEKTVGEQIEKKRKEKTEGGINALEIGKAINADSIITGTVFVEPGEQKSFSVKIASFQLIDASTEKSLLNLLFEFDKGKSLTEVSRVFIDTVKQNMR